MAGWTVLLVWAVQRPVERRFVILLTALMVAAFFLLALVNVLKGNTGEYWEKEKGQSKPFARVTMKKIEKVLNPQPISELSII